MELDAGTILFVISVSYRTPIYLGHDIQRAETVISFRCDQYGIESGCQSLHGRHPFHVSDAHGLI